MKIRAMVLESIRKPLREKKIPRPKPKKGQVLVEVTACAVCRTDLHVADGELPHPKLPLILGHEIVGKIKELGPESFRFKPGDRVGIPWLGWTCGECRYCLSGQENLCNNAQFTGYQIDGGYAEYTLADERYCFPIPEKYGDLEAAPLLCAGLIGYRSLKMAEDAKRLGIYGFGAAAHLITQVAVHQGKEVFAFTRSGDLETQRFALKLGAIWAGDSDRLPPTQLDAALLFAPVGALIPQALRAIRKGGIVVCGGIHMSDIPSFPYEILWGERCIKSVANLTRKDAEEFLRIAAQVSLHVQVQPYPLQNANQALDDLRHGRLEGAAVLTAHT